MFTEKEETKEYIKEDIMTNEELFHLSDEELKNEIRKRRCNELIDDIKENEIKIKSIKISQSPDIAKDLITKIMSSLKRYMKLQKIISVNKEIISVNKETIDSIKSILE